MTTQTVKPGLTVVKKPTLPAKPTTPLEATAIVQRALMQFGQAISGVSDDDLGAMLTKAKAFTGVLEAAEGNLKRRIEALVRANGEKVTDKGTMRLAVNGYVYEAKPTRTGYDAKKLEALLRMNGVSPDQAMDAVVTYKVNEGKLSDVVLAGNTPLTEELLEQAKYDINYSVSAKPAAASLESGDE